jgi:hypothetical protein
MSSGWLEINDTRGVSKYYNETYNSVVLSNPTDRGMTDTLDSVKPSDHLFFDDDPININQVATADSKISLKTIFCPPGKLQLLSSSGGKLMDVIGSETIQPKSLNYNNAINYAEAKFNGGNLFASLLMKFDDLKYETDVGRGLTIDMIDKIITHVSNPQTDARCKYYFDFDKLLSHVEGLLLDLFKKDHMSKLTSNPTEDTLLESYAKYLFSNYDGDEPTDRTGRMAKLQNMFTAIDNAGIAVYIVTNNPSAARGVINGNAQQEQQRILFIKLIKKLFPKFVDDHLICSKTNAKRNKGHIIVNINDPLKLAIELKDIFPKGGMKRTKPRKSQRRYKVSSKHIATTKKQRNSKRYKNKRRLM